MALSSGVVQAAASYRNYVREASSISATFPDAASIQTGLTRGAAYEPNELARGAVAYAAVLALQDPAFVQGVRTLGADANNRASVTRQLFSDPAYAAQLPGASSAAGTIVAIAAGINPPVRGSTKTLPTCLVETEEELVNSRGLAMA